MTKTGSSNVRRTTIPDERLRDLRRGVHRALILPDDHDYDQARSIWNSMIDRRPAAIVRAASVGDVVSTVDFAREIGLDLAVKGGGHNIAGSAISEGGITLDLSAMKSIRVFPATRMAKVAAGVTLGELDQATQEHGLALPLGINSTTGIAGLTLGGGFGWLSRRHGLTIDNLIAADVVTADGRERRASLDDDSDLFWAIRGGGGNFGIVTSFEYRLQSVGPTVFSGFMVHPLEKAGDLLRRYRDFAAGASEDLAVWAVLRLAPPLPFIPTEWHGRTVVILAFCYIGAAGEADSLVTSLRALGQPVAENSGPMPLVGWQTALDPLLTPGARNYWKSHYFRQLVDGAIDTMVDAAAHLPSPESEVFIAQLGGAINRVATDSTAYPHRDVEFAMNAHARWRDPAHDTQCTTWARQLFEATRSFATGGVYVNFMPADEPHRVEAGAYGPNFERLSALKAKYDPGNLFHLNQNVLPAVR